MAAYVPVPRDLSTVKNKVIFNLTRRQLICFGAAIVVGVPAFFILKNIGNASLATMLMIVIMMPFFMFAMYEKNGQPLEVILGNYIRFRFLRPRKRIYQTDNYYAALIRQDKVNKEVNAIVGTEEKKTQPVGKQKKQSESKQSKKQQSQRRRSNTKEDKEVKQKRATAGRRSRQKKQLPE